MSEARDALDRRLAAGEIEEGEYDQIRAILDRTPALAPLPLNVPTGPAAGTTPSGIQQNAIHSPTSLTPVSFLAALWGGQISLPAAFWGWGIGGSLIIGWLARTLMRPGFAILIILLVVGLSSDITVAIFRSARRYSAADPRRPWGRASQLAAIFILIFSLGNVLVATMPGPR